MALEVLTDKHRWARWKRAFHLWQLRPHQVAPNDNTAHICQSCGTAFCGNYCPRCGQSSRIGRFSFKTALELFLATWGLGNRSFFLTIRDMMLRPGYMIRDYVRGCQSAYFPPFQMFFLLATFSLVVDHGFNLRPHDGSARREEATHFSEVKVNGNNIEAITLKKIEKVPGIIQDFHDANPALFSFLSLMILASPMYLLFRRCPAIPDLRFSEHIIALIYAANAYSIYQILAALIPIEVLSGILQVLALIMLFVALKQFTGFSKRRILLYMSIGVLLFCLIVALISAIVIILIYYESAGAFAAFSDLHWNIFGMECAGCIIVFTLAIIIPLCKNPVWWIHDYPEAIQQKYFETHPRIPTKLLSTTVLMKKGLALVLATAIFVGLGLLAGASNFLTAFVVAYGLWLIIDWYDCFFLDWVLFANIKRVRLPGTEDMDEAYHEKGYHFKQSCIGMAIGLIPSFLCGCIVALI